jgi:hypothetical protein
MKLLCKQNILSWLTVSATQSATSARRGNGSNQYSRRQEQIHNYINLKNHYNEKEHHQNVNFSNTF